MKALKYVILGAGGIARHHAENLSALPNVKLVGVQDIVGESLERWKQSHPGIEADTDPARLLSRTRPDLACVCSANVAHAPLTQAAFEAGCHVMCEKPMAMTLREAQAMESARAKAGKLGAINFSYRSVPAFRFAAELVRRGELGRIQRMNVVYLQSFMNDETCTYSWRNDAAVAGFGAMGDLGVHMLDGARFISGLAAQRVVGLARTLVPQKPDASGTMRQVTTDTNASFLVEYEGGVIGTFETSQTVPGYGNHFELEISGDRGLARVCSEDGENLTLYAGAVSRYATWSRPPLPRVTVPSGFIDRQPRSNHQGFVAAIRGEKADYPSFADGVAAQAVLEGLVQSMKRNAWVDLSVVGAG